MLHFEDHALARRKPLHCFLNLLAEFLTQEPLLRIRRRSQFRLAIEEIARAAIGFYGHRRLILATAGAAAQVIERHISHDSIQPGVEAALEPETVQIPVNPEKALLVDIPGVLRTMD